MSKKVDVEKLLDEGMKYEEIEAITGTKLGYIRSIAANHRKNVEPNEIPTQDEEPKTEEVVNNEDNEMHFENDLEGKTVQNGDKMEGKQYHKAWVAAKAYECSCGCTLNRRSTYCPNCGVTLDWGGF